MKFLRSLRLGPIWLSGCVVTFGLAMPLVGCTTDRNGALIEAAKVGDASLVARLLERGASVEAEDKDGVSALKWAAANGHLEATKVLLSKGATVQKKGAGVTVHGVLWATAQRGHVAILKLLLSAVDDPRGHASVCLLPAIEQHRIAAVRALLDLGADPNVKIGGESFLTIAEKQSDTEIAQLLRDAGAK